MSQETLLDPLFECALSMFVTQSQGTHTNPQVSGDDQVRHSRCVFRESVGLHLSLCVCGVSIWIPPSRLCVLRLSLC